MHTVTILTERTQLDFITIDDLLFMHELHSMHECTKYNTLKIPENLAETEAVLQPLIEALKEQKIQRYTFVIKLRDTKLPIGLFGFNLGLEKYKRGEIWYKLHPTYWNKGYATEIVKSIVDFGFNTLNLHRIEAGCAVDNIGSFKVLEKVGFTREGRHRQILPLASGWSDNFEYAILESDPR